MNNKIDNQLPKTRKGNHQKGKFSSINNNEIDIVKNSDNNSSNTLKNQRRNDFLDQ